ncbi:hypothetical protein ACFX12_028392 [Malus domestica]
MNPISYRVKVRTLYKLVIHVKENMMPNMQYLQHSGVSEKPWIPSNLDVKGCQVMLQKFFYSILRKLFC